MPEPRLDERAVEAAAAWVARAASDEQRWEPTSWEVACAREAVAAYFAALDREALTEHVMAGLFDIWPEHMAAQTGAGLQWGQLIATRTVAVLFTPDTEEPT